MQSAWKEFMFEFVTNEDRDYPTFKIPEILVITIEEHQVLGPWGARGC